MASQEKLQHFRADERPFIERMEELAAQALNEYRCVISDFLNPRQQYIVESLFGTDPDDFHYQFFGGYADSERRRLAIAPTYYEFSPADFNVVLLEIHYPVKFADLSHGQILGTLLHAGLERFAIGDIITDGQRWQFLAELELLDFFTTQIDKISTIKVRLEQVDWQQLLTSQLNWVSQQILVTSLRLDTVVAGVFNISRQRAKGLIEAGQVQLNWVVLDRPDELLAAQDILSVRRFGRVQLLALEGKTRRDRLKLKVAVLESNHPITN